MLTKGDKILIFILVALVGVLYISFHFFNGTGKAVVIEVDDRGTRRVKLPENSIVNIKGKEGLMKMQINGNRVRMLESSCPNKICVKTGWIEKTGETIICLPNRAVIKIVGEEEDSIDGISR